MTAEKGLLEEILLNIGMLDYSNIDREECIKAINQFKKGVIDDLLAYLVEQGYINSQEEIIEIGEKFNTPEPVDEVKGGFCPYCKTYNAYSVGDHTECNNCENVWAS